MDYCKDYRACQQVTISAEAAGTYSYDIICTGAPPAASTKATVDFTNASVTVNGSKGGGGALDP
jgi:hypothetical protein